MLQLLATRSQISFAEPWLEGLRRFDAAQGSVPLSFARRRLHIMALGGSVLLVESIGWGLFFLLIGQAAPAYINVAAAVLGLLTLTLLHLRLHRVAALLFLATGMLALPALAMLADIPDATVPRTLHLLLIPFAMAAFFLTQHETRLIRVGAPVLIFCAFCVLSSMPTFGMVSQMSDMSRKIGAVVDAVVTAGLVYVLLVLMLREARENSVMERDFARALATGQLQVFLQAQCTAEGGVVGAEALMRWCHPRRGYISPAEFIPVAEACGLIVPAGEFMVNEVCKLLEKWQADPALRDIAVAVNVSPAQLFSGESSRRLQDLVPEHLCARRVIKFELTESLFVRDFDSVRSMMEGIRAQGIRISLDDFGTGFSSLSYLKKLPLDQLKVDQSFVRDMPHDDGACKIANTIVHLGSDLDLEVIAEGVEKPEQVAALQKMGCALFQGYFFARPVPADAFEAWVHEKRLGMQEPRVSAAPLMPAGIVHA